VVQRPAEDQFYGTSRTGTLIDPEAGRWVALDLPVIGAPAGAAHAPPDGAQ
jgi:hypothetical protein